MVESWVMGKEKGDTPHKRAGTVYVILIGAMDRRAMQMTVALYSTTWPGRTPKRGILREAKWV
jgi:hypothetical protein